MCFSFGVREKKTIRCSLKTKVLLLLVLSGSARSVRIQSLFLLVLEFYILNGVGSKGKRVPNPGKSTKWAHCGPVLGE